MLRSMFDGKSFRMVALLSLATIPVLSCGGDGGGEDVTDPDPIPGFVSGSVVDGSGTGVANAQLDLVQGTDSLTASSGSDGTYLFSEVPAGSWNLGVIPPNGYELAQGESGSRSVTVEEDATTEVDPPFELASTAPPADSGTVNVLVNADDDPREGVDVSATLQGTSTAAASGTTAADGTVGFDLGVGDYDVEITIPDGFALAQGESNPQAVNVTADAAIDMTFDLVTDTTSASADTVTIGLNSQTFSNPSVNIGVGDVIRWVNNQAITHSITPDGHNEWSQQIVSSAGQEFFHTFDSAGSFDYYCFYHGSAGGNGMAGTITVE